MPALIALRYHSVLRLGLIWLLTLIIAAPEATTADEPPGEDAPSAAAPAAEPPKPAKPAEALAGDLVRVRPEADRKDDADLLNKIDLAKNVVYTTTESPVPESEQFQFIDGVLRTPEKGDARLVLPIEVPGFYRLSLDLIRKDESADPPIGIGALMDGHQFFAEMRLTTLTLSRFYGQEITKPLAALNPQWVEPGPEGVAELLIGDYGMLFRHREKFLEWLMAGSALSLDETRRLPAIDKIFLTFPDGQFDLRSITLEPLTRDEWIEQVTKLMPAGEIASAGAHPEAAMVSAEINPLPELEALRPTILTRARRGDFDELERWAERFRSGEVVINDRFVAEDFYHWLTTAYVASLSGGSQGKMEGFFQAQFAFINAWLKQKPDSVAARIVKGRSLLDFAWDVRGGGFARDVPVEAWQPFKERLETAEETLNEAARLKPRDVCVFSTMLRLGKGLNWAPKKMERTVERGLQVSKKDPVLIDSMVTNLLPRWGGKPGDLGGFALRMSERIKGDDGLYIFIRVARMTQAAEVSLKRMSDDKEAFAQSNGDFTDPTVVLKEFSADKLRAAIPVLRKRHPKAKRSMNYVCWLYCVLDEREAAKELFAEILDKPDLDIWETRDRFDHWRRWCDPSIAEPSQPLPIEGQEIAHFQAYSAGAAKINFLLDNQTLITGNPTPASAIKFWDLGHQEITRQFEPPDGVGDLINLWLLDRGHLFVPMSDERKNTIVEYLPPDYGKYGHYPANFFGNPFNLISDDGTSAAELANGQITIGNAQLRTQNAFSVPKLTGAGLSPDGKYLLGAGDKIHLWESMTGTELMTIDVRPKLSDFMRDGSGIIYVTDDQLVVWDISGNKQRFSILLSPLHVVQAARSTPDGRLLAVAERRADINGNHERHVVALYDLKKSEPFHVFGGHKASVDELAISHNGNLLASSSVDGVVKVWNLAAVIPVGLPAQTGQLSEGSPSATQATMSRWRIAASVGVAILLGALVAYRSRRRR